KYPLGLALVAMAMTTLLQSATATIGLLIGLSTVDAFGMTAIIPVVVGANVGQGITMMLVGWKQINSRRLAGANLLLKCALAVGCLPAIPYLAHWMDQLSLSTSAKV